MLAQVLEGQEGTQRGREPEAGGLCTCEALAVSHLHKVQAREARGEPRPPAQGKPARSQGLDSPRVPLLTVTEPKSIRRSARKYPRQLPWGFQETERLKVSEAESGTAQRPTEESLSHGCCSCPLAQLAGL